jgi:hypothetical protein
MSSNEEDNLMPVQDNNSDVTDVTDVTDVSEVADTSVPEQDDEEKVPEADVSINFSNSTERIDNNQAQVNMMNRQVYNLEREMLLGKSINDGNAPMSNWTKVFLTALAVILPGIGQIIGIIAGLVFVSNDTNSDKRTFGAALLTVSLIAFVLMAIFWFIAILAVSPDISF